MTTIKKEGTEDVGDSQSTSVRYVSFNGKGGSFVEWKIKTLSLARKKKFDVYLTRKWESTDSGYDAEKYNDAWDQLVISLSGTPFSHIMDCQGDPYKAWMKLVEKYEASSTKAESLSDVVKEWNECKLGSLLEDPDDWFAKLFVLNQKFKEIKVEYGKDEAMMKAHVLTGLPDEYSVLRTQLYTSQTATYDDYKRYIHGFWWTELGGKRLMETGSVRTYDGRSNGEEALNSENYFNGKCRKCSKWGHRAKECKSGQKSGEKRRFEGTCNWCGKKGHKEKQCFAKKNGKPRVTVSENSDNTEEEVLACMCETGHEVHKVVQEVGVETWLADSGATCHLTKDSTYLRNQKKVHTSVRVSSGEIVYGTVKGDVDLLLSSGRKLQLRDVLYVPSLHRNLISTNKLTMKGGKMMADSTKMTVKLGKLVVTIPMVSENGKHMYVLKVQRARNEEANNVDGAKETKKIEMPNVMDINDAHGLCHLGEKLLRTTFSALGTKLTGKLRPCEGCCLANARAKAVRKSSDTRATKPGERLFVDTSGPYSESLAGNRYWVQVVDDFSRKGWSKFRKSKVDLPKVVDSHIKYLRGLNHVVKYLRCDNAGEHQEKLRTVCNLHDVELEYTAPHTPQMNGVCERRIAVNLNGARAFLYASNFNESMRKLLWAEAVYYTEQVRNAMSTSTSKVSADVKFWGKHPNFLKKMVEFGRIAYVTKRDKMIGKLDQRGVKMIMVGYAEGHSSDVYRMYNPGTKRVILTRDVTWAEWQRRDPTADENLFSKYPITTPGMDEVHVTTYKGDENGASVQELLDEGENSSVPKTSSRIPVQDSPIPSSVERYRKGRERTKVRNELRKLRTSYNPTVSPLPIKSTGHEDVRESVRDGQYIVTGTVEPLKIDMTSVGTDGEEETANAVLEAAYNTAVTSDEGDPRTFKEAMASKNSVLWTLSAIAEVNNFLYRKAWTPVKLSEVRKLGRKVIGVKWVFKTKSEWTGDLRLKSRIVTLGYMQVPGVDFTEKFSPVANDTSTRIIILLTLYYRHLGWECEVFDVEAAFLEPYLDNEMYIKWPEGIVELGFLTEEERDSTCIRLERSMYGNVDAALRWLREFKEFLVKDCNFTACVADPCILYYREGEKLLIVMSIHVDDSMVAGMKEDLNKFYEKVRTRFNITELGTLSKYLGVRYEWLNDKDKKPYVKITMKDTAEAFVRKYEECTGKKAKLAATPGYPNQVLIKNEGETVDIDNYRSLVGKLLFYIVKVGPDCANAGRDLARHMANPGPEHWKAMGRMAGYLKNKIMHGHIMRVPRNLSVVNYSDASYGVKSISGSICTVGGTVTSWGSRTQKITTLSSTESEYVALGECGQELKFVSMLLAEIGVGELPGTIFEDNEGAIFLAKNQQVSMRTKHIDVRCHFIRDLIMEGLLKLKFVGTDENYADFMTKNVSKDILQNLFTNGVQNGDIVIERENVGRVRFGETEMAGERTEAMAEGSESPSSVSTPDGTHKTRD